MLKILSGKFVIPMLEKKKNFKSMTRVLPLKTRKIRINKIQNKRDRGNNKEQGGN